MNAIDRLFTKTQAAEILAMSVRVLDRRVEAGEITAVRDERQVKFRESELLRYMSELPSREPRSA
jgi:excisionase family DNA binding protein